MIRARNEPGKKRRMVLMNRMERIAVAVVHSETGGSGGRPHSNESNLFHPLNPSHPSFRTVAALVAASSRCTATPQGLRRLRRLTDRE